MEILTEMVRYIFWIFLIYTVVFILQWIVGLCVSVRKLSRYRADQKMNRYILPDRIACRFPVSVIIPAYNEENCIQGTVDSVLEEDHPALEVIVVDDGSTDGTARQLLEAYGLKEASWSQDQELETQPILACYRGSRNGIRITLVRKKNGGKADALNCGLNLCESPYCVILDADTKVERGSIRIMESQFLMDDQTIVCAGAVGDSIYGSPKYKALRPGQRALVLFQKLEYYRTFYMQRVLFDCINANVIVSGAFAMFDSALVKKVGGYRINTVGEDMELTMRLHAFCLSQHRRYHIAYAPEARCWTQVPFTYRDYYRQRRRWHIGMIQSFKQHIYMLGSLHYGWAGVISGSFVMLYEFLAPFIEVAGLVTLALACWVRILNVPFTLMAMAAYAAFAWLTQSILLTALRVYQVEPIRPGGHIRLILVAILEFVFFHPLNIVIKWGAFLTHQRNRRTWQHIQRARTGKENGSER